MLVVSRVCVSLLCCCPPGCYVSGCPPSPQVGSSRPFACPTPKLPTSSSFEGPGFLGPVPGYWVLLPSRLPPSLLSWPRGFHGNLEVPWGFAQEPRTIRASSCSLTGPTATLLSWPGPQIPAACPPGLGVPGGEGGHDGGACSGQLEELGRPGASQAAPVWWGRGSFQACALSSPQVRAGLARLPSPYPLQDPCLCLLCTPFAWAAVSALLAFLLLPPFLPHPSTCGSWAPRL